MARQSTASGTADTEEAAGADLPPFVKAEPGHKQSGGLFVPGKEPGHWPDARCKGPDAAQPRQFKRPGDTGRWGRLRPRVRGTDGSGLATTVNP